MLDFTGKTFVALDWAMCIGFGVPWHGHVTAKGPVVYMAAEGGSGFSTRVRAWKQENQMSGSSDVYFLTEAVMLRHPLEFHRFMAAVKKLPSPPRLVVIDTLARALAGGDENSAKDMGEFIFVADQICKQTGATVLLIHHVGKKGGRHERGSSALRGAADTMMFLSKRSTGLTFECTKQKDAVEFKAIPLRLNAVKLEDGKSSCVLVKGEPELKFKKDLLSKTQKTALMSLDGFGDDGATSGEWRNASGLTNETFYRASRQLRELGLVERPGEKSKGEKYTLTPEGRYAVTVA